MRRLSGMGKIEMVAVQAAIGVKEGENPRDAWDNACNDVYGRECTSRDKVCPRSAFLGLCGGEGISADYARSAAEYLLANSDSSITATQLWRIISDNNDKANNQRTHVVLAIYKAGLLNNKGQII